MSDELPELSEGQTIVIGGSHYTVESVDPTKESVRAYYLNGPIGGSVRLEPNEHRGTFTLIRVDELDPSDVLGVKENAEE